jgi:hypothetical protein
MKRPLGLRYRKLRILANDLQTLAASHSDTAPKIEFAWINDEVGVRQIAKVAARERRPNRVKMMQRNLAAGGRIAVALDAGEPVSWQMLRPQEQVTFRWLYLRAHDAVFVFGSYTVRSWRGHRLMTHLTRFAAAPYAGGKFRRLCSIVDQSNRKSMRGHTYRGDQPVGWITSLHLARGLTLVASDARIACGFFNDSNPFVYTVRG